MEVIWSRRAIKSLKAIWEFYNQHSHSAAVKMVNGIKKKGDALSTRVLHQSEEHLQLGQYRAVFKYFKIIYKVENDRVLILQIFDARQNPDKLIL